jgi:hypothetical protein
VIYPYQIYSCLVNNITAFCNIARKKVEINLKDEKKFFSDLQKIENYAIFHGM